MLLEPELKTSLVSRSKRALVRSPEFVIDTAVPDDDNWIELLLDELTVYTVLLTKPVIGALPSR